VGEAVAVKPAQLAYTKLTCAIWKSMAPSEPLKPHWKPRAWVRSSGWLPGFRLARLMV
jgi:hypothetical protein